MDLVCFSLMNCFSWGFVPLWTYSSGRKYYFIWNYPFMDVASLAASIAIAWYTVSNEEMVVVKFLVK